MKNVNMFRQVVLITLIFAACKKTTTTPDTSNSLTANVDGVAMTYTGITTTIKTGNGNHMFVRILGYSGDTTGMGLDIYPHKIAATATIDATVSLWAGFTIQNLQNSATAYEDDATGASGGTITITENDTTARRLVGSFSGIVANPSNASDIKNVKSGAFAVSY